MSRFVLTAQLQLQAPRNTRQVVSQIQRQLQGGVNLNINVRNGARAQTQVSNLTRQVNSLNTAGQRMGRSFGVAIKRFAAFSVAARGVSLFTSSLGEAFSEAIRFERELVKVSQVTGKTLKQLDGLSRSISKLSAGLGVSSKELLSTTRILAQAGIQAKDLDVALSALAKTSLAPTFENIEKTAEGAVAILAQFGQGVGALEKQLGAINSVAGKFAVESGDLISAVRRTGGVFKAAGGDLNELLGLFTSIRATTRESAESIATGLRTIFTRIQRPKTIEFLKQFGVELTDIEGKFIGPFEAVKRLSSALSGLQERDITFVKIAEELGGFRQIGKVIPLLQQFETAERARQVAIAGSSSLNKDYITAQKSLAVQFTKVREEFLALVRGISETGTFQILIKSTLALTSQLIKLADAFKPLLPLIGAFAAFKMAKGAGGFLSGIGAGISRRNMGGPIGFARGGVVPGHGNRDTVPAMLTPGEFVIRKSSVQKIGANRLAGMNKYAKGGNVTRGPSELASSKPYVKVGGTTYSKPDKTDFDTGRHRFNNKDEIKFSRTKTKEIDVNKLNPKRNDVKAYKKAKTAQRRGIMFEDIAKKEYSLTIAGGSSRLDASGPGGYLYEIKSELKALSDSKLAEKMVGASISPISDIDKNVQKKLRNQELSAKAEDIPLGRAGVIQDITNGLGKFFGGAIQKFALGGLAQKNKIGFAILDPDQGGADLSASVTRAQIRGAVSGTDAQKKALDKEISWPSKKFNVARQGLPEKTSQKFYDTITKEAVSGVDSAANSLSQTLGQGAISMPESAKETMAGVIGKSGSQMGRLFEDVLDVIDNRGDFKPAPKNAFWDFKGGLTGGLATTYNKMPSSFVDARTSYGRSTAGAAESKIIGEIAQEYQRSSTYKTAKKQSKAVPASALAAQEKRRAKQAAKMEKARKKAGFAKGGPAPSDTVPAMLTPGEFVINKKAASKIGAANLDRMNKHGVAGFAAGGPVTSNRHFYGDPPYPNAQRFDSQGFPIGNELIIPGERSVSKTEGPGPGEGAKVLIQFVEEMDNATGTLIDLQGEMENFKTVIINVLKGIAAANRGMTVGKQPAPIHMGGSPVSSPDRKDLFKKGPAGLLTGSTGKKKEPKANTPKKQEDAAKKALGPLEGLGVKLLGLNAVFSPFIKSGEEAAKNSFNLANALQTGLTRLVAFNAAVQKSRDFLEANVKKDKDGNFTNELIKGGTVDKFSQKIRVGGKKLARSGRARSGSAKGVRGLLGKASGKVQQRIGGGLGKLAGGLTKFGPKFLKFLPGIGNAIGAVTSLSSALSAGFASQEKYNLAVQQGNVQKAQEFAVLKELSGVEQAIVKFAGTDSMAADIFTGLRGTTTEYLMASAKAAAIASKADKEKAANARLASDAFKEVAAGTMTLTEALSGAGGAGFRNDLEVRNAEKDEIRAREGTRSTGFSARLRDVGNIVSAGLIDSANTKNLGITSKNEEQEQKSQEKLASSFESIFPQVNDLGREFARSGGTLEEFKAKLRKMGIPIDEVKGASERVTRAFGNNLEALKRSREAFQALNFGLAPLIKTTEGLNTGLNTLTDISNGTYNALNNAKGVLQTAATGGVVDDKSFNEALSTVEKDLKAFGGGEQVGKIRKTITSLRAAFEGAGPALEEFRGKLISGEIDDANPQELIKGLTETLTDGMSGESKKIIQEALGDIKLDKDAVDKIINDGNLDELFKTLEEKGQEAFKELGPLIDNIVNAQSSLLDLTKKRIAAEQQVIAAQLSNADAQKEAANLIAEFSGRKLSGDEQANLAAGRLRATGINSQSAGSLSSTLAFNSLAQQNNVASLSATGNAALGGQDRAAVEGNQQKLNSQNAEILTYARERVKIYQQEIAAAKQRLKLDQDAAKALLSGDIEKFSESINASIASDAFRSGDTSMLQGMGGEALAAGFDALTDEEKAASSGTLESLGISSGLADAAAGTSPEIEALQAEAIEYAEIIAQSGDAGVRLAEASLTAAENLETLGRQALKTAQDKAAEQQAEFNARKKESEAAAAKVEADRKAKEEAEKAAKAAEEKRLGDAAQAEADAVMANSDEIFKQESDSTMGIYFGRQQPGEQIGQSVGGSMWNGNNEFQQTRNLSVKARGGTIYASRGMFVPKGTDTVPAMLTPGEFVVNRAAVQRGNNLQMLRAMNGGDTTSNGAPAPSNGSNGVAMAKGGMVKYFQEGGEVGGMGDFVQGFSQAIGQLGSAFGTFAQSVDNLANMKLNVDLSPTSVNVNVMGPLLSELTEQTKEIVLNAVVSEIKLNQLGNLERTV